MYKPVQLFIPLQFLNQSSQRNFNWFQGAMDVFLIPACGNIVCCGKWSQQNSLPPGFESPDSTLQKLNV